ncbi:hypothetical protein TrRE_jg3474 [Triparma retinervis]|uniref:Uncharacterized protein n=1 Tax=Triparma retinervis TaxID=2557542 RepID=A0A9W7E2X8_9STRA|nr:hypothetical protein TrRE_jg3474 [Triparma retinervis]
MERDLFVASACTPFLTSVALLSGIKKAPESTSAALAKIVTAIMPWKPRGVLVLPISATNIRGHVVQDSSEELAGLREDLRYWQQRLKLERVKVEPVRAAVERLKEELEATANAEGIGGGWMGAVGRAAFLIGCNVDVVTGGRLEGRGGGEALMLKTCTKYGN